MRSQPIEGLRTAGQKDRDLDGELPSSHWEPWSSRVIPETKAGALLCTLHLRIRIKETKEVYEGEVTELTPEDAPNINRRCCYVLFKICPCGGETRSHRRLRQESHCRPLPAGYPEREPV